MTKQTILRVAFWASAVVGLGLIFIGARFLLAPEVAEQGFGLRFDEGGNYAFHTIKGIRDIYSGLLIVTFVALRQRTALTVVLGGGVIVPLSDMLVVLTNPAAIRSAAWIHGITVIVLLVLVVALLSTFERVSPKRHVADEMN